MFRRHTVLCLEELEQRQVLDGSAFPFTDNGAIYLLSDQLNTPAISGQLTNFIATHFVGTEKLTSSQNAPFKAINPNWVLLNYRLATSSGPVDYIVGDQWGSDWPMVTSHEDWFMHNADGVRLHNGDWNWYLHDISNPDFRQYWVSSTIDSMRATGAVGIMADSFDAGVGSFWFDQFDIRFAGTHAGDPAYWPNGVTWLNQMDNFASYVLQQYAATPEQFVFLPNLDALNTSWENINYNQLNGAFLEGFGDQGGGYLGGSTGDWILGMNRALPLSAAGAVLIMQPYLQNDANSTLGLEQRGYELGTYLLLQGQHTFLNVGAGPSPTGAYYYPEDTINLDNPLTPVATDVSQYLWNGIYRREFQNGIVLVNPTNNTVNIPLDQSYQLVSYTGGGALSSSSLDANGSYIDGVVNMTPVNSVTLAPSTAAILLNPTLSTNQAVRNVASSPRAASASDDLHHLAAETVNGQVSSPVGRYTIAAVGNGLSNHALHLVSPIADGNNNLLVTAAVNSSQLPMRPIAGITSQDPAAMTSSDAGANKILLSGDAGSYGIADALDHGLTGHLRKRGIGGA